MHLLRKQDYSLFYFLQALFSAYPNINIQDGFPQNELELPTISVEADDVDVRPFELGNRVGQRDRIWFVDVFAQNKDQRDELAFTLIDALEDNVPVYDYDEGFPPSVSPTQIGALDIIGIRAKVVRIFPQLTEKLYWRISIIFSSRYVPVIS